MRVQIKGQWVSLDQSDLIGTGGEGLVFRHGKQAVKVYHPDQRQARVAKLEAFVSRPAIRDVSSAAPLALVLAENGDVAGFSMALFGPGWQDVAVLSKRQYRAAAKVTTRQVAELFLNAAPSVERIHKAGYVIGDFSDTNLRFQGSQPAFVDADCWQFDTFPCPVGSEQFLPPDLYGLDLSLAPVFKPEHDWYSFAVLLFKSLMGVHPYGGTRQQHKLLTQAAREGLTVFSPGVKVPAFAAPREILTDRLLSRFESIFKGERVGFSVPALDDYLRELIDCPKCGSTYPRERRVCPVCNERQVVAVPRLDALASLLLKVEGRVLLVRCYGQHIYALAEHKDVLEWSVISQQGALLGRTGYLPGTRYDLLADGTLVTSTDGQITLGRHTHSTTRHALTGADAFRVSGRYTFSIMGGYLWYGEVLDNDAWSGRTLRPVMNEHTWFAVRQDEADLPTVCGYFQVYAEQQWWLSFEGQHYDRLPLTALRQMETVVDILVRFDADSALIMRRTEYKGASYVYISRVHQHGAVLNLPPTPGDDLPHGAVYSNGTLLVAEDGALVSRNLRTGLERRFEQPRVESGDRLVRRSASEVLVVKESKVLSIRLG